MKRLSMFDTTRLTHCAHGIFTLDSGFIRAQFDAIHLIVHAGRAVIIDTATANNATVTMQALHQLGIERHMVDAVILTHVHLDHAGGAGSLMKLLPEARLLVHPRGKRHMVDPTRLWAGTCDVYGETRAQQLYGRPIPIDESRTVEVADGATFEFAGRVLEFINAPGHARHHVVIRDTHTGHCFTGDVFGVCFPDFEHGGQAFPVVSSTPVQFDPDAMRTSVKRVMALKPGAVYQTHFGMQRQVEAIGERLLTMTDDYEALGRRAAKLSRAEQKPALLAGMRKIILDAAHRQNLPQNDDDITTILSIDIELNAAGLQTWIGSFKQP